MSNSYHPTEVRMLQHIEKILSAIRQRAPMWGNEGMIESCYLSYLDMMFLIVSPALHELAPRALLNAYSEYGGKNLKGLGCRAPSGWFEKHVADSSKACQQMGEFLGKFEDSLWEGGLFAPALRPRDLFSGAPTPLNPGIVKTVEWLNGLGFKTVDSGDGVTHDFECDRSYPYVVVSVEDPRELIQKTQELYKLLVEKGVHIEPQGPEVLPGKVNLQADYDPATASAMVQIMGISDELLFPPPNPILARKDYASVGQATFLPEKKAYTVGNAKSYDRLLDDRYVPLLKKGSTTIKDYDGGWVWKTPEEARAFLWTPAFAAAFPLRNNQDFAVYEMTLPAGWDVDVSKEPLADGAHHLLNDAVIVARIFYDAL